MSEKNRKPDAVFRLGLRSLLPTDKTEQDARKTRFLLARPNRENEARYEKDKEGADFSTGVYET